MAISFFQEPQLFTPATNPIIWVFSSDQTGQANFSYKVELIINGALFGTYELYPMFDTYAKFDASECIDYQRRMLNMCITINNHL
jgi:hypothetical protein